ncbi:MAG: helix-turn-helix domain-containing protein [Odoribacter splanchnicus]
MGPVRKKVTIEVLETRIEELETRLSRIKKLLNRQANEEKEYLSSEEVMRILHISSRTLQNYRSTGKLPYFKPGKITLYHRKDVEKLLKGSKQSDY